MRVRVKYCRMVHQSLKATLNVMKADDKLGVGGGVLT
jgi:hypothetical protein